MSTWAHCCHRRIPPGSPGSMAPKGGYASEQLAAARAETPAATPPLAEPAAAPEAAPAAGPVPAASAGQATAAPSAGDWGTVKAEATKCYMADDLVGAIEGYGAAIKLFEALHSDEPERGEERKPLAVLYTNRAQCHLQIISREQAGKKCDPGTPLPQELRKHAMKANVDASNATELDDANAKAWLRKGQALLWMSALQQRAKQSVDALVCARDSPTLPAAMKPEVAKWLKYARMMFDNQTDMPENCPQM